MIFTYNIESADDKGMVVWYHSQGLQSHCIGVRTPLADETLENVIREFAPLPQWQYEQRVRDIGVVVPQPGTGGTIDLTPPTGPQEF
jgi:hypothetical protein